MKSVALAVPVGALAGLAAAAFLHLLSLATFFRSEHPAVMWGLPCAGLVIGWLYHAAGREASAGHALILEEIRNPKKQLPLKMAPLVLGATLLTHFFGGSAGREGTAVQMGGSLADQILGFFKITGAQRKRLLIAGMGAGFGGAIGAPWAGALFGLEVVVAGKWRVSAFAGAAESFIASFVAYGITILLRAPHSSFPWRDVAPFDFASLPWALLAGVAFGIGARIFILGTHLIEKSARRFVSYPPLRPFVGGILLLALNHLEGSFRYAGLGVGVIQESLLAAAPWTYPILKAGFTALTLGTGFKGGEFIPLVFIGTTLGSFMSLYLPASQAFLGTLGFGALFGAAAKTPLACVVMVMEIFGWRYGLYGLAAGYAAFFTSGKNGIYV